MHAISRQLRLLLLLMMMMMMMRLPMILL